MASEQIHTRSCRWSFICLVLLTLVTATGCQPGSHHEPLPTFHELGSRRQRDAVPQTQPQVNRVRVTRIQLPAEISLDNAWALTKLPDVDALTLELWRDNGLQVRILDAAQTEQFSKALPSPLNTEQSLVIASRHDLMAISSNRLREAVHLPVHDGDGKVTKVELPPGLARFLLRIVSEENASISVELTPQHYWPQTTLLPREPQESELDGLVFEALRLRVSLHPNQYLIVGVVPPMSTAIETSSETTNNISTSQPTSFPATQPTEVKRIRPLQLADLLLKLDSGSRRKPRQILLVFTLAP